MGTLFSLICFIFYHEYKETGTESFTTNTQCLNVYRSQVREMLQNNSAVLGHLLQQNNKLQIPAITVMLTFLV